MRRGRTVWVDDGRPGSAETELDPASGRRVVLPRPGQGPSDVEDRYLQLREENLLLKKSSNDQEEKIKQMATKLTRITADLKRRQDGEAPRSGKARDKDTEDMIGELQRELEEQKKRNAKLSGKVKFYKQTGSVPGAKQPLKPRSQQPYDYVQSRIDTGVQKKLVPLTPRAAKAHPPPVSASRSGKKSSSSSSSSKRSGTPTRQSRSSASSVRPGQTSELENRMLQEMFQTMARMNQNPQLRLSMDDQQKMQNVVFLLHDKLLQADREIRRMQTEAPENMAPSDEDKLAALALERDAHELALRAGKAEEDRQAARSIADDTKRKYEELLKKYEDANETIKELRQECQHLKAAEAMLKASEDIAKENAEIEEDLRREIRALDERNQMLLKRLMTAGTDKEKQYEATIQQLEETRQEQDENLRKHQEEAEALRQKMEQLSAEHEQLSAEKIKIQSQYYNLQHDHEVLSAKMKAFYGATGYDFEELDEALAMLRARKAAQEAGDLEPTITDEEAMQRAKLTRQLEEMAFEKVELANEVERLQRMLMLQEGINTDYKKQLEEQRKLIEQVRAEYTDIMNRDARVLDVRTEKIKKLEGQLRDVVYGQLKTKTLEDTGEAIDEDGLELAEDENVCQISIKDAQIRRDADFGDHHHTFVTLDFFEHATQITPACEGLAPDYDYTIDYVVKVDDWFLQYLWTKEITMELNLARGTEYSVIGRGTFSLRDLLERPVEYDNVIKIKSVTDELRVIARVHITAKMLRSISQHLKVFQERAALLSLLDDDSGKSKPKRKGIEYEPRETVVVKVIAASGLRSRDPERLPAPFVYYDFYEGPEYDTPIVAPTANPVWDDSYAFPVVPNAKFKSFVSTGKLELIVFDNDDPDSMFYLGKASVALDKLKRDGSVYGEYPLLDAEGLLAGHLTVFVLWQSTAPLPKKSEDDFVDPGVPVPAAQLAPSAADDESIRDGLEDDVLSPRRPGDRGTDRRPSADDGDDGSGELKPKKPTPRDLALAPVRSQGDGRRSESKVTVTVHEAFLDPEFIKQELYEADSVFVAFGGFSTPMYSETQPVGERVQINFARTVSLDPTVDATERRQLYEKVLRDSTKEFKFCFCGQETPPSGEEDADFFEVASAGLNLAKIAQSGVAEVDHQTIELRAHQTETYERNVRVGSMVVSVRGVQALRDIVEEQVSK